MSSPDIILIPGAPVLHTQPGPELQLRLDGGLEIAGPEDLWVTSGRANSAWAQTAITEAEAGKNYLTKNGVDENAIFLEMTAVESLGNFVFSRPLIDRLPADHVTVVTNHGARLRTESFVQRFISPIIDCDIHYVGNGSVTDTVGNNHNVSDREERALAMYSQLLDGIKDGDYLSAIEMLLTKTPFYNKGLVPDVAFFDKYWPGGFESFRASRGHQGEDRQFFEGQDKQSAPL